MHRLWATFLLVSLSFPLIAPAMFANASADLPACCRRTGKHHCVMTQGSGTSSGAAAKAASERCPFELAGRALPAQAKFVLSGLRTPVFANFGSEAVAGLARVFPCTPSVSSCYERGPPRASVAL